VERKINKQIWLQKLEWQDEYFAVSVSESQIDIVRNYIKNQEAHHKHKTFQQEYDELISKFGFKKFSDLITDPDFNNGLDSSAGAEKEKLFDSNPPAKAGGN
jgi:hypothetical protein